MHGYELLYFILGLIQSCFWKKLDLLLFRETRVGQHREFLQRSKCFLILVLSLIFLDTCKPNLSWVKFLNFLKGHDPLSLLSLLIDLREYYSVSFFLILSISQLYLLHHELIRCYLHGYLDVLVKESCLILLPSILLIVSCPQIEVRGVLSHAHQELLLCFVIDVFVKVLFSNFITLRWQAADGCVRHFAHAQLLRSQHEVAEAGVLLAERLILTQLSQLQKGMADLGFVLYFLCRWVLIQLCVIWLVDLLIDL